MKHAAYHWSVHFVSYVVLLFMVATLTGERSVDKLRLTVHRSDLLPSVRAIQGACRCYVDAIPLGGEEDEAEYWRLSFNTNASND